MNMNMPFVFQRWMAARTATCVTASLLGNIFVTNTSRLKHKCSTQHEYQI
jgi:hypothetical protein